MKKVTVDEKRPVKVTVDEKRHEESNSRGKNLMSFNTADWVIAKSEICILSRTSKLA
jgi:hypothetical protein